MDCGYSLEPPRLGGSNEYPTIYVLSRNMNYIRILSENFHVLVVKFSIYLNRHVSVMLFVFNTVILINSYQVQYST